MKRFSSSIKFVVLIWFFLPGTTLAGTCERSWDGDKIISLLSGQPSNFTINLIGNGSQGGKLSLKEIEAFYNAKEQIQKQVGLSPKFLICGDSSPNAFATQINGEAVVGVTYGMLKMIDGDEDMAAIVIGHEFGHHVKNHMIKAQRSRFIVNLLTALVGAYVDHRIARRNQFYQQSNIGRNVANIGGALINAKFSRGDEIEADELGLQYIINAGFNPLGAIRLSKVLEKEGNNRGMFLDSHPGWGERAQKFELLIAKSPEAQKIIAQAPKENSITLASIQDQPNQLTSSFNSDFTASTAESLIQDAVNALDKNDLNEAIKLLREASDLGDAFAQAFLGTMYHFGQGVPKNQLEAVRLYKSSALQGLAWGQINLGHAYEKGDGVPQNYSQARLLYSLAAKQGHPRAKADLGYLYLLGNGVDKDEAEALRLMQDAAELGDAMALRHLGYMYQYGVGVYKDHSEAIRFYNLASEQGNALATTALGLMYESGLGVSQNYNEAIQLYRRAAELNDASGQFYLGNAHYFGRGINKDYKEAVRLFRLSAQENFPYAQDMLGYCLLNGKGVSRDKDEAIIWFKKAASNGVEHAIKTLRELGV